MIQTHTCTHTRADQMQTWKGLFDSVYKAALQCSEDGYLSPKYFNTMCPDGSDYSRGEHR